MLWLFSLDPDFYYRVGPLVPQTGVEDLDMRAARAMGWKELGEDGFGKPPKWLLKASGDARVRVKFTQRDIGPIQARYYLSVYQAARGGLFVAWRTPEREQPIPRRWDADPAIALLSLLVELADRGEL